MYEDCVADTQDKDKEIMDMVIQHNMLAANGVGN